MYKLNKTHYMKNFGYLILGFLLFSSSRLVSGQQADVKKESTLTSKDITLSIVENSTAPHTDAVHTYRLSAVNNTSQTISFFIAAENISCVGKQNSNLKLEVVESESLTNPVNTDLNAKRLIQPNTSTDIYIRLIRPAAGQLDSWNCVSVTAKTPEGKALSEPIIIESYIPDPENFR
jgi:hypothetical protein